MLKYMNQDFSLRFISKFCDKYSECGKKPD